MLRNNLLAAFLLLTFSANAQDKWDVSAEHGPVSTVEFTTTEGTWMNLDVSPDGQTVVFDMLGDIYSLPIAGGKANLVAGGPAFDLQPRFSPDGSRIAFTSDRAGGDNLWTMNVDGSDPQQVTKESFRLLNGPAWTPDGEYLLVRKHFTSTRSLGAGEVWMYHASGEATGGLQLTSKKNSQQDQGSEISVSPDGRYVYFSEDMSGGSTFQYNKDPNGQIYVVRRLDRETGELTNLITGAGGSARPQPSPDGETIAFVRRVRTKSVLYLYDISSGAQKPLYDGLSHDQQEAWAIFGVYPAFDWTPDSKHIVIWAQGKIWKIDASTGEAVEIPFEVDVSKKVTEAVRFQQDIDGEQFSAKMIRQAATSPDGRTLVFHAVGNLWKQSLPDGRPERLTSDDGVFEYEPSFSPDGSQIVYTTWNDDQLSTIRVISLDGSGGRTLTSRPGYYSAPRYSPDGSRIVYRRGGGNSRLGYIHGVDRGLYWMASNGGEAHLIRQGGSDARFDETGERIYFRTGGGLSKEYKSVRLDGGDERTHFDLKYVVDIVPSPDGKWVAFTELYNAYIAPFPKTGQSIELSKGTRAIPVKQVTRDAGTYLHWSGDGTKLHWVIGPEYFTRELKDTFDFVAGAPDELPEPDTEGVPIRLPVATDIPTGKIAFTGARLITMNGNEVIEGGTLVVDRNKIVAVGSGDEVDIPSDATVVDATGKTIIPGFVDVHAHVSHFGTGPSAQRNWPYYANLAYGVTTAHDPSATTETVFSQSELVRAGLMTGPRIFSTGTILYGADGDFKATVDSLGDARSHLRRMKAVGAFSVKSYNQPRRDQRQQVLTAARELEMLVVPEGGSTFFHNLTMIVDGHTGIEHNIPVAPLYRDVLKLWEATEVGYTPTLVVNYGGLSGEYYWYEHSNVWENERLLTFTPRPIVDSRSRRRQMASDDDYYYMEVAADAKKLVDQGNWVQIGAHGQLQGLAAHWELWMFEQGGMTPHEALRSATLHGAKYLGLDESIGSLEEGKLADLVVLSGNPLEDIRQTDTVESVMVNGRLFDAATMNQIGNHPAERGKFYWEKGEVSEAFIWHGPGIGFAGPTCSCGRH